MVAVMPADQREVAAMMEAASVEGAEASAMKRCAAAAKSAAAMKGSAAAVETTPAAMKTTSAAVAAAPAMATAAVSATDFGGRRARDVFREWRRGRINRRKCFCALSG
jgi:hypothetical protein